MRLAPVKTSNRPSRVNFPLYSMRLGKCMLFFLEMRGLMLLLSRVYRASPFVLYRVKFHFLA